ncbi:MAG TPA: glycosyltransferase family 25 protein [Xanthobacteraceae bacterium]|nr:glycosyltransferase family 25 protein [Xanthobacteraceae bacterium]
MKNYIINLQRQPEKFERFSKLNAGSGIAFERFEASDGSAMSEQETVAAKIMASGTKLTKGAIGCGASHQRIWKEVAQASAPALVFEDDAVLRNDLTEAASALLAGMENWDILVLGYNTDSILDLEIARGISSAVMFTPQYPTKESEAAFQKSKASVAALKLNHCFGTSGYAISPAGAKKLLKFCFPMDNRPIAIPALKRSIPAFGLDCMLNGVYKNVEAFACFAPLVLPRNDRAASTVQK